MPVEKPLYDVILNIAAVHGWTAKPADPTHVIHTLSHPNKLDVHIYRSAIADFEAHKDSEEKDPYYVANINWGNGHGPTLANYDMLIKELTTP